MSTAFLRAALCVLVTISLSACKDSAKEQRRNDLRALMHGTTPDPEMKAAMEKAQATLPQFLDALQKPAPNQRQFMVRKIFPAKDSQQQILIITNLTYDGTLLHGRLDDNTAKPGSGVPRDGKVSFPPTEVADWMFNEDGKAVGGFMLRALKSKMTDKEWADLTRQIQFKE